jgi:hypothetical protein
MTFLTCFFFLNFLVCVVESRFLANYWLSEFGKFLVSGFEIVLNLLI